MTTVTLNDGSPSEQILSKAAVTIEVHDSTGRKIVLKKPGILAQYRIVEVVGDSAKNEVYMQMVMPLIYVVELDNEPITQPKNKMQLEALMQRLDDHGVDAVMVGVMENFGKRTPEADATAIKK